MNINFNRSALQLNSNLNRLTKSSSKVIERLSSGLSINRAADDVAGLAISEKMRAQIRGLAQASRNTQNAISLLQTSEGALGSISDVLQRMRELSIRSMNDSFTESDRLILDKEFNQLKQSIDNTTDFTEWNEMKVIDQHQPQFSSLEGNNSFPMDRRIEIINGFNDELEISIDGQLYQVQLPEGHYDRVDILLEKLDEIIYEINPDIIITLNENRTITLDAENSLEIEAIKGSGAFLFYDYQIGNPPGMIIGSTKYIGDDGVVHVIAGQSDELSFFIGSNDKYTIKFDEGTYTRQQAIDYINTKLQEAGAQNAEAIAFGSERIAIVSDKYAITGVGGNMIEIDDITSILYDNRKAGSIQKTQASVTGLKSLSAGVEFKRDENNLLDIYIQGEKVLVDFLASSELQATRTAEEIKDAINLAFTQQGIDAKAEINNNRLTIIDNYYGNKSAVIINNESTAFDDLFVSYNMYYQSPIIKQGANPTYTGNHGIGATTRITNTNNILIGEIDGVSFSITLEAGNYTPEELLDALNEKAQAENLDIHFSYVTKTLNGNKAIVVTGKNYDTDFKFDANGQLFASLMKGASITQPEIRNGKTTTIYPPEGEAKPPAYIYDPAVATGRSTLDNLTISSDNNILTFKVNDTDKTITLLEGNYATAEDFIAAHQAQFESEGVRATLNSSKNLILSTIEGGEGQTLTNFGGSSHGDIMGKLTENLPNNLEANGATSAMVTGRIRVPDTIEITSANNKMEFTYTHEGTNYDINLEITEGNYSHNDLVDELNTVLELALTNNPLAVDEISFSITENTAQLQSKGVGSQFHFSGLEGELYDILFSAEERKNTPLTSRTGITRIKDTYIVSREVVKGQEFIIHPNVNDLLYFDFYNNGTDIVIQLDLQAGKYSETKLVTEINRALSEALLDKGIKSDFIKAQIGGVGGGTDFDESDKLVFKINAEENGYNDSGHYRIDGVRGTAAYTFFYPAQGEPSPTFTVGSASIANGVRIEAGMNDTLTFDIDSVEKTIVLAAGNYTEKEFLDLMNEALDNQNTGIIASSFEGNLKLSNKESGYITLDGIRGNGAPTFFYKVNSRLADDEWVFHTGANSGQNITVDKARLSTGLLRISNIMIDNYERSERSLGRLDQALNTVNTERARLGAHANRLEHTFNSLGESYVNLVNSESRIRDTDIAKAMMDKVKNDILITANQELVKHVHNNQSQILQLLK